MLNQLYELAQSVVDKPVSISALSSHGRSPSTPKESLKLAEEFATTICEGIDKSSRGHSLAEQGAVDLFAFLRNVPQWIIDDTAKEKNFRTKIKHAWQEPEAGAYVGVCALVQDIWEHLRGPEAVDDPDIERLICAEGNDTVLDFGSGAGHFAILLAQNGSQVDCVEACKVKQHFLKFRAQAAGLSKLIRSGQRRSSYGLILAINVLDHLKQPDATLEKLIDLLAPDGRFVHVSAFVNDGWHQANESVKERLANTLLKRLKLTALTAGEESYFEMFCNGATSGEFVWREVGESFRSQLVPRLHPAVRFKKIPGEEQRYLAFARRFYVKPTYMNEDALKFMKLCNGNSSLAEICSLMQVEFDEIWPLVEFQWSARTLGMQNLGP